MADQKKAHFQKCYYRSMGPQLTVDALFVDYLVNGDGYSISLPNNGWSLATPALQFIGYIEAKPSDFDGSVFRSNRKIKLPVVWDNEKEMWFLTQRVLMGGKQNLQEAHWFNPNGTVWNGSGNQGVGGMSFEPGSGNKSEVEIEE